MARTDTGRIGRPLPRPIRSILFGGTIRSTTPRDLPLLAMIDRAHLLMLVRAELVLPGPARQVIKAIDAIEADGYASFRDAEPIRGLYLLWEDELRNRLGDKVGGLVHLARSRNDMNATLLRLRLRTPVERLLLEGLRLNHTLILKASEWVSLFAPGYTHYQPAQPLTFGHMMAGWSSALVRDLSAMVDASADLERSALGAGAIGGTYLPIDPSFTADLLGFTEPTTNSLDAVAARDVVLRILSAAAVMAVTVSRFATDLLIASTQEFGFVTLPDDLVGSSSQMPQKRNPFILEHVQSRGLSALGAFVTAATRMHATPFTNSVAVGTEAIRPTEAALTDVTEATCLLRHVVAGLQPNPEALRLAGENGFVHATALADQITLHSQLSFREAHQMVGRIVTEAEAVNQPLASVARRRLREVDLEFDEVCSGGLEPCSIALSADFGGGPGSLSMARQIEALIDAHATLRRDLRGRRERHRTAERRLALLCQNLICTDEAPQLFQ